MKKFACIALVVVLMCAMLALSRCNLGNSDTDTSKINDVAFPSDITEGLNATIPNTGNSQYSPRY